jgi:hypothetical protein
MFRPVAIALTAISICCFLAYRSAGAGGDAGALESFVGDPDFVPRQESVHRQFRVFARGQAGFAAAYEGASLSGHHSGSNGKNRAFSRSEY